jgi:hypothetical protein
MTDCTNGHNWRIGTVGGTELVTSIGGKYAFIGEGRLGLQCRRCKAKPRGRKERHEASRAWLQRPGGPLDHDANKGTPWTHSTNG